MKNEHMTFLKVAKLFAENSTCCSKKTGCCIVKDKRIIATGYNGVPKEFKHCEDIWIKEEQIWETVKMTLENISDFSKKEWFLRWEECYNKRDLNSKEIKEFLIKNQKQLFTREKHHEWSKNNELHAEANTLIFCAKNGISTQDSTMYMTISPCVNCALLIIQSGIKEIFFEQLYDLSDGISILENAKIKSTQIY